MKRLAFIKQVYAHCDLPCGVYDPVQARVEALSVKAMQEKYQSLSDTDKIRALYIKEERAELVKHHVWVLWTDYFKPEHTEQHPGLHDLIWRTTKQAGVCKRSQDPADGQLLIDLIDQVGEVFAETKKQ